MSEKQKEPFQTRSPDFRISGFNKRNNDKGELGAAWKNKDGSITLRISPFIVLPPLADMIITLFPNKPFKAGQSSVDSKDEVSPQEPF